MYPYSYYDNIQVTYSSDYFETLYSLAIELIRRGKAYVCHQKPHEIKLSRENQTESPWRNRGVEENLKLFEEMRNGIGSIMIHFYYYYHY